MILALAGRRIDAAKAKRPRFPLSNVELVRKRIRAALERLSVMALVSSAACGADLIALSEAGSLGIERKIVLPFQRALFREISVVDRPGDWGPVYDRVLDDVKASGGLVVLAAKPDEKAFLAVNKAILQEVVSLAQQLGQPASAVLVWDGNSRDDHDVTEQFGFEAHKLGLPVNKIGTL